MPRSWTNFVRVRSVGRVVDLDEDDEGDVKPEPEPPDERLPVPATRDEVARLGETLNEMLARLGEAGFVQDIFGDRVGHDRSGCAAQHVGDGAPNGFDRGRCARCIRPARFGGDTGGDRHDRQRGGKCLPGSVGPYCCDRNREPELRRAAAQKRFVANQIKRRDVQRGAPMPDCQRKIRSDSRRLAERQSKRLRHCYLRSIIA